MRHSTGHSITIMAVLLLVALPVFGGSAHDLFQQALVAERSVGDLQKAIDLYGQVVKQAGSDRALAVRALLQMGSAYEKLGKAEAKKAYARIVNEFADQQNAVAAARERLARLEAPAVRTASMPSDPAARRLWDELPDMEGEVSRDGRYFSYIAWDTGDLAIRDLRTGERRRLTNSGPWGEDDEFGGQSRFSADGKLLAYTWYRSGCQLKLCPVELRVVSTDGESESRVLLADETIRYVEPGRFSPDGKRLLVSLERVEGRHELGILTLATLRFQTLGRFESHAHPVEFSPDGKWVLFMKPRPSGQKDGGIFLIPAAGGEANLLVQEKSPTEAAIGFSLAGDQVIFGSHRSGENALWAIPIRDGRPVGEPEVLRQVPADQTFGLSSSNDFYFGTMTQILDGYIIDIDDQGLPQGKPRRLTDRIGQDRWPIWNGDGSKIAFVSGQSGVSSPRYVVRDAESGKETSITAKIRPLPGDPIAWSPDGKYFAVTGRTFASSGVRFFLVDAETGEVREITDSSGRGATFSPDGKLLYYPEPFEGKFRIMAYEVETGKGTVVYESTQEPTTSFVTISPDGRYMLIREQENDYRKEDLITITDFETGERRDLLREPVEKPGTNIAGFAGMVFTGDGKYVIFGRWESWSPKNRTVELWRVPVAGGPSEPLGIAMPQLRGMRIHPNGNQIGFTAGTSRGELWVLENFLPSSQDDVASR